MLGRTWHRDTVYAVAARSYMTSGRHDHPWIGSDLELRDEDGVIQPGYGWVFPLADGEVHLGVGPLATAARPASVADNDRPRPYARSARARSRASRDGTGRRSVTRPRASIRSTGRGSTTHSRAGDCSPISSARAARARVARAWLARAGT